MFTLFSLSSWFPVLSTEERRDDLASTSLENSCGAGGGRREEEMEDELRFCLKF